MSDPIPTDTNMDEPIVEVKHLTKRFELSSRQYGLKNILLHLPQYIHDRRNRNIFTALDDMTFSVRRGERIGLVGPNGCGKTTLLSVIGGVYRDFEGEVNVRGRVSMMLALGAGMHPDLSGRENIVLNGVLQGKTRDEMNALMNDIIAFADIGQFIDAPVYTYSSGMKARLGFGVATAIHPDILLVDEVMAVGDADFAAKCRVRINGLLAGGTTLFLVSHNMNDIRTYCKRVIKIEHGRIIEDKVTPFYGPVSKDKGKALPPKIPFGKPVYFRTGSAEGNSFFLEGLSHAEPRGTWTLGRQAVMTLQTTSRAPRLHLQFDCHCFHHPQPVKLSVNGDAAFDGVCRKTGFGFSFRNPGPGKDIRLIFELPGATAPVTYGIRDSRILALFLKSLVVTEGTEEA